MSHVLAQTQRNFSITKAIEKKTNAAHYRSWGHALGMLLPKGGVFVVACDHRPDSLVFKQSLVSGLAEEGIRVVDIGRKPTVLAGFACNSIKADGFASVTRETSSPEFDRLRWMLYDSVRSSQEQSAFLRAVENERRSIAENGIKTIPPFRHWDPTSEWIYWLQQIWYDTPNVPLRVILDPMNGSWARLASLALLGAFPHLELETLHDEPFKGSDPGVFRRADHGLTALRSTVVSRQADFGVALTPDADRVIVVDDQGTIMSGDEVRMLFLQMLGESLQGEVFLHGKNCGKKTIAEGKRLGGHAKQVADDEFSFVSTMRKTEALIGFGSEGHVYYRGIYGNLITTFGVCWIIDYLSHLRCPLSVWRARLTK